MVSAVRDLVDIIVITTHKNNNFWFCLHIYYLDHSHILFFRALFYFTTCYSTVKGRTNPIEVRGGYQMTGFFQVVVDTSEAGVPTFVNC